MPAPHPPEFRQRTVELARQGTTPARTGGDSGDRDGLAGGFQLGQCMPGPVHGPLAPAPGWVGQVAGVVSSHDRCRRRRCSRVRMRRRVLGGGRARRNLHVALYYKAGGVPWRLPRADRHPGATANWTRPSPAAPTLSTSPPCSASTTPRQSGTPPSPATSWTPPPKAPAPVPPNPRTRSAHRARRHAGSYRRPFGSPELWANAPTPLEPYVP
jgi:hypothetical protein